MIFAICFSSYNLKLINIALKFLHKHADVVSITDSVMYLDCKRQQPFSIPLEELTHTMIFLELEKAS